MIPPGGTPEPPFKLEAPPNELWTLKRMCREFGVDDSMIHRWVADGRLPKPWVRRGGRPLWAPEQVRPAFSRRQHRLGLE
jgi:hypothetical protein